MTEKPTLIPLDGSDLAREILDPITPLLKRRGQSIVLLRVVRERGTAAEQSDALDLAQARLSQTAALLEARGFRVTQRLERGEPAERILEVAREVDAGLVAMATHGRTGASRLMRGSVAERVLREITVPLFVGNPQAMQRKASGEYFERILVPLDGSTLSDQILPAVTVLALAYGSKVTLLRVHPMVYTEVPSPLLTGPLWDEQAMRESLETQRQRLAEAGVQVEVRAVYGVEVAEILSAADDADLVAMSTHGRSGFSRWWFGSVAESVIRHCPCPLLVRRTLEG
ncbi:MAG: universal stress protein [Planctomycetota bacterium]